jgi:hypothetical protein
VALTIKDVSGWLKAAEDHFSSWAAKTTTAVAGAKLLLTAQEERALQLRGREAGEGSSAPQSGSNGNRGGRGKGRGRSATRGPGGGGGRSGSKRIEKD